MAADAEYDGQQHLRGGDQDPVLRRSDGLMRARSGDLRGIVNGIDYDVFNPETDPDIVQNYNAKNFRKKVKNKRALQEELGLAKDDKEFMIGIVSRLTNQKGLDLIQCVMDEICTDDVQLVVLGTGDENYENMFRHYDWKYHDRVSAQIYYSGRCPTRSTRLMRRVPDAVLI